MSHNINAQTVLSVEHADVIEEQIPLTWEGATVEHNANINGQVCDIVVRRAGNMRDIGLKVQEDGTYQVIGIYNSAYGRSGDAARVIAEMQQFYENYCIATAQKQVKKGGRHVQRTTEPVEAHMDFGNGKEKCVMVEIHIGSTSSTQPEKDQSAATGGYN